MLEGLIMNKVPKVMLPVILTLVLLLAGCFAGPEPLDGESPTAPVEGTQVGNLAPDFKLPDLDGQAVSLSDFRGKPVLINFWATWCPPCRYEMPFIQEIYEDKAWQDKGLVIVAVNTGESRSKVEDFMENYGLSFLVLLDIESEVARKYNAAPPWPVTFFIDKDGIIQEKVIGAFQDKTQIENRLSKIIP